MLITEGTAFPLVEVVVVTAFAAEFEITTADDDPLLFSKELSGKTR